MNEKLNQYDLVDGEYIEQVKNEYALPVGLFLFKFSAVEHSLNIAIAEAISERGHESGYIVIEKLRISDKIDLFYKLYIRQVSFRSKEWEQLLCLIKNGLMEVNRFRNAVAHANWLTLTKDGCVRTKIVTSNDHAEFVTFKMLPDRIKEKIKELEKLTAEIDGFTEATLGS